MTKICPRCKKTYSDFTRVCRLPHCPNCGSTNLEKPDYFEFLVVGLLMGPFMVLGVLFLLFLIFGILPSKEVFMGTGLLGGPIFLLVLELIFEGKWHCKNCDERFYFPVRNVPLVTLTNTQVQGSGIDVKENVCPVCGAPVEPGAKYCWRCGSRLG
jgi:ribosomal protein L40E